MKSIILFIKGTYNINDIYTLILENKPTTKVNLKNNKELSLYSNQNRVHIYDNNDEESLHCMELDFGKKEYKKYFVKGKSFFFINYRSLKVLKNTLTSLERKSIETIVYYDEDGTYSNLSDFISLKN